MVDKALLLVPHAPKQDAPRPSSKVLESASLSHLMPDRLQWIKTQHEESRRIPGACRSCLQPWPCHTSELAAHVARLQEGVFRMERKIRHHKSIIRNRDSRIKADAINMNKFTLLAVAATDYLDAEKVDSPTEVTDELRRNLRAALKAVESLEDPRQGHSLDDAE